MKFKVLAYTFSLPLLWATILLLQIVLRDFGISRFFSVAVLIGLLLGSLIGRFFRDDKYLTNLLVNDERVSITYLTPLAKQRQMIISLSILTDIKMQKKIFLVRDFGSIRFLSKDNQVTFHLLNSCARHGAEQLEQTYSNKLVANNI